MAEAIGTRTMTRAGILEIKTMETATPIGINQDRKVATNGMTMGEVTRTAQAGTEDTMKVISIPEVMEVIAIQDTAPTMAQTQEWAWAQEAVTAPAVQRIAMARRDTIQEVNMDPVAMAPVHMAAVLRTTGIATCMTETTRGWDAADTPTAELV